MPCDLAVLVPSRGRPRNVDRLITACGKTCRATTHLWFGFDADDPQIDANTSMASGRAALVIQPRMSLTGWTNYLAAQNMDAPYLASLGDDMVPVTDGWDELLITAIEHYSGVGYAYPDDRRRNDIPEAVVVSTVIVAALGSMCPVQPDGTPVVDHWFVDCMWKDLGMGARCICYVPEVIVEHRHPNVTGQPGDATYNDAAQSYDSDLAAYQRWRMRDMPGQVRAVQAVRGQAVSSV